MSIFKELLQYINKHVFLLWSASWLGFFKTWGIGGASSDGEGLAFFIPDNQKKYTHKTMEFSSKSAAQKAILGTNYFMAIFFLNKIGTSQKWVGPLSRRRQYPDWTSRIRSCKNLPNHTWSCEIVRTILILSWCFPDLASPWMILARPLVGSW